jgi:hypothetical protein
MKRHTPIAAALLLLAGLPLGAQAQEPATTPSVSTPPCAGMGPGMGRMMTPEQRQQRFEQMQRMTPEQRQQHWEQMQQLRQQRWEQMGPGGFGPGGYGPGMGRMMTPEQRQQHWEQMQQWRQQRMGPMGGGPAYGPMMAPPAAAPTP